MPDARKPDACKPDARDIREVVIISGKGGTGKTSLTGAFAALAHRDSPGLAILADLDVDAPDLHILLEPDVIITEQFHSGNEAVIDPAACTGCGTCADMCRFDAIRSGDDGVHAVEPLRCEGCKVCVEFCPEGAIAFPERHCGYWCVSSTRLGPMVHAQLFPGQENSGRLVILLKKQAKALAQATGAGLVLCDGAPGIGCPVISSLSGTDLAVIVTEPTPSGRHDLERVAQLCDHFRIPVAVMVNKHDVYPEETRRIEALCLENDWTLVGRLPHDPLFTEAMVARQVVTEHPDTPLARSVAEVWDAIVRLAKVQTEPQPAID